MSVSDGFDADRLAQLDVFFAQEFAARRVPGAAMLIWRKGQVALRRTWGLLDPAGTASMRPDAIFRINSMTKPIVSVVTLMLMEEGRLGLAQPVSDWLSAFADLHVYDARSGTDAPARPMTVLDLLRHTAGLTYGTSDGGPVGRLYRERGLLTGTFDNAGFAERLAAFPLAAQPGTTWEYSHATDLLGRVLEVASGQTLSRLLRERLLDPLDMRDTDFHVADPAAHDRIAEPFAGDSPFGPNTTLPDPRKPRAFESGGGGLVSTLDDYARFCAMLIGKGRVDGQTFLSPHTVALMTADHIGAETGIVRAADSLLPPAYGFGLGLAVRRTRGGAPFPGTPGDLYWSGIAGASFWIDAAEDLAVICLTQAPTHRERVRTAIRGLVYGALTG